MITMLTIEEHQKLLQNFIEAYNEMISSINEDELPRLKAAVTEALEKLNINK